MPMLDLSAFENKVPKLIEAQPLETGEITPFVVLIEFTDGSHLSFLSTRVDAYDITTKMLLGYPAPENFK